MKPFRAVTAVAAPLDMANVNTDQIFPARFVKKPRSVGYAQFTFHDVRRHLGGEEKEREDFPLNQDRYRQAKILVCGINFGCGSSREGAVYTLMESGVAVLIAPSFGDIFAANCLKNGLLTVILPETSVAALRKELQEADDPSLTVDLESETITRPSGTRAEDLSMVWTAPQVMTPGSSQPGTGTGRSMAPTATSTRLAAITSMPSGPLAKTLRSSSICHTVRLGR